MEKKKQKKHRVGTAIAVTVRGVVVPNVQVSAVSGGANEITEATVAAFYVDGGSIGVGDGPHSTPWSTLEDATAAATAYAHTLNVWWAAMYPGETYIDEAPIIDEVHPNLRAGILPSYQDNPPAPPAGAVQIPWGDGTAWVYPP